AHHPLVHDQESARERDDDLDPAKQQGKPELRHGEKTNEELDPRDHEDRPERPADWGLGGDQDRYTRGDEPEGGDLRRDSARILADEWRNDHGLARGGAQRGEARRG